MCCLKHLPPPVWEVLHDRCRWAYVWTDRLSGWMTAGSVVRGHAPAFAAKRDVGLATIVRAIELLDRRGSRALHRRERWPLREKVAGLERRDVTDPIERV